VKIKIIKNISSATLCLALIYFTSCKSDTQVCAPQPDISGIDLNISIENLNEKLSRPESKKTLQAFLDQNEVLRDYFLRRIEYPNDSIFIQAQYDKFHNPFIDTIFQDVNRVFGDLKNLEQEFTQAFKHIKFYYPDFVPPKIQVAISGFDTDLIVSDSLIIIGLDYYLGADAKFRPRQMYDYMLRRYHPEYIVPSTILLFGISEGFNKVLPEDNTVLADMIAYGKSFYFTKHMMPCTPDSILIWYTQDEIEGAKFNEAQIWNHFIDEKVLYSNSHMVKRKYIDERPGTYEINEKCPGRIATWTGWQIVKNYAHKNSRLSLTDIMNESDAQKIFKLSGYKP
jgi:gliding motility-associated lipoprotein GldB